MTDTPNNDWKSAFAETMYKRLYWQGYRGEFVAFNWPTFADSEGPREWPIVGDAANITFNPSDLQAYRSAQALKNILASYRGEFPDLKPVHLLAHSMGNIVAGEALRQWAIDPNTTDPLVTTYVAMEAAVSSGAYGSNDTDSQIIGRPDTDLYRFWSHGRDGLSDPSLGVEYYFQPNNFSWEHSVNMYNAQDYALDQWDNNNWAKDLLLQSPVWPYDYEYTAGDGGNVNTDTFTRVPDVGPSVNLTLTLPNGQPGRDAYEILAFFAQSASLALGTKDVTYFDSNIDVEAFGMLGGSDIRANHSYQFNHDAAETWEYYSTLKAEMGFGATHGAGAGAGSLILTSPQPVPLVDDKTLEAVENSLGMAQLWMPTSNNRIMVANPFASRSRSPVTAIITGQSADLALLDWIGNRSSEVHESASDIRLSNEDKSPLDEHIAIDGFFDALDDSLISVHS